MVTLFNTSLFTWQQGKFSELYKKSTEKNDLSFKPDQVISVATMSWKNAPENSSPEYMKTYNIMHKGDIAFEGHKSKDYEFGRFVENTLGDGIVSHIFDVYRPLHFQNSTLNFWKYYINLEDSMRNILRKSTTSATMMRNLVKKDLYKQNLSIPSTVEQEKIGKLLSKIDYHLSLLQRKKSKYEYLKTALFQNLFPEKNQVIPNLRRKEFNENWKKENLGKLVNLRGRIGFRGYKEEDLVDKNKGALVLSPADIKDNGRISNKNNKYISWYKYNESPEIKVKKNDIIFTKTASIGKIAYLEALNGPTTINPQLVLITPIKISSFYLYLYLNTDVFKRIIKGISGGSSVQTISQEELKQQNIYFPNNVEQEKINKIISNLDNIIVKLDTKIIDLNKFKQFLLQNMFI